MLTSASLSNFINFSLEFLSIEFFTTYFAFKIRSLKVNGCTFIRIKITYIIISKELDYKYDYVYQINSRNNINQTTTITVRKSFFPNAS
jgi:hypothetical protein